MIRLEIQSLEHFVDVLSEFGEDVLLRGQPRRYVDAVGMPKITSAFQRRGCEPALRFKWTCFTSDAIRFAAGNANQMPERDAVEALLQHYGWPSFFVDLTSNSSVAAWFAGYQLKSREQRSDGQDCFGTFVRMAQYAMLVEENPSEGIVYAVSKSAAVECRLNLHDLSTIVSSECAARVARQHAWVIQPPPGKAIPEQCILAEMRAPVERWREIARGGGFQSASSMFPSRTDDYFLTLLYGLPWVHQSYERRDVYVRSLPIPEYDYLCSPFRYDCDTAFYSGFWEAQDRRGFFRNALLVSSSEHLFHVLPPKWSDQLRIPGLFNLLKTHPRIAVETDYLVGRPHQVTTQEYTKGIFLELVEQDVVALSEFVVSHPGLICDGARLMKGWHYKLRGREWVREARPADCPCGNTWLHETHRAVVHNLERILSGEAGNARWLSVNHISADMDI